MERLTKEQIVNETVDYYKNNERSISAFRGCAYLTSSGARCAHSRCISEEYINRVVENFNTFNNASKVIEYFGDEIHIEKYRGHSSEFWDDIQRLHDNDVNWIKLEKCKNELTTVGLKFVESLKEKYKL